MLIGCCFFNFNLFISGIKESVKKLEELLNNTPYMSAAEEQQLLV